MKAAVISLGSISSQWVATALQKYFSQVDLISLKEIEVWLGKAASILYRQEPLPTYDCIYLKGSFRYAHLLSSIATVLQDQVPYLPISPGAYTTVHNKLLTHLVLQQRHIPMPKTYVTSTLPAARELLKKVHYPIVMKFPEGTQGKGVMFADSFSSASSLLDALGVLKQPFIIQEYIETEGKDIRALVVGDKVVAAMQRVAQGEEKRSNIHAGGKGIAVTLSREVAKIAVDTAKALGADVCGVDILESPLGPLVIEANISPGLQGLQQVTSLNIAEEMAQYFAKRTEELTFQQRETEARRLPREVMTEEGNIQEIITNLQFRGERILLPEIVSRAGQLVEGKEYIIRAKKGKVEIIEEK